MRLFAEDLDCVRGGRAVFEGIAFSVGAGEALCVTGRNGAGKSSLLRQIAGLVRVAHGTIALDGGDPELSIAEQLHYLGHLDALKASLSVHENLTFWARYLGGSRDGVDAALAVLELDRLADLPAAYLSAGQRRRLSIARLLAAPRPVWLLDEPTSALDALAQARVAELMRAHLASGGMIVAAAHGPIGLEAARELRLGEAV
ncbi:MAG: heme ABC exporter ATP-binding protein CcmA [Rhizobiales bacterium]|nr:heme ABC exporter ATP-binding protein CcmA [Hyphomicrobiales bacterium]